VPQDPAAHHRREGERDDGGDQDRHGERHGELAEEAPHDVAHEEQGDQHRDQRNGQRDDGEADLLRPLQGGLQGRLARLDVPRDVLDHDDRVVHDESRRDRQRHQRQVVQAVAEEVHRAERPHQRERHRHARDDRRRQVTQEEEDHHHDQRHGEQQLDLDVVDRGADGDRPVGQDGDADRGRQGVAQLGEEPLDPVHDVDDVGPRLPLDVDDDGRGGVHPGRLLLVLRAVDDVRHVGEQDGRPVPVRDDEGAVLVARQQLVVGVDRDRLARAVEAPLGQVDVRLGDRRAQVLERHAEGGEGRRVGLDPHGRLLPPADADEPDAGQLRDLLGQPRVGQILHLGQRQRLRRQPERQDRRVGRVGLGVDRRVGQVLRQVSPRGVDGRLDLLLRHVDVQVQRELQRDDRAAERAGRRHLVEPGHLPELALQGRGDGGGHHVGAGARIERLDLDGRVVHLRQGRDGEEEVGDAAGEEDRRHEQRRRDGPQDEGP
jgi:hypothetical protein